MARQQIFIIDTSVAIKWFSKETDSDRAHKLLNTTAQLITPDFLLYEFCNVVRYKWTTDVCVDAYKSLSNMALKFVPLQKQLAIRTLQVAQQYNISSYDACFVALAQLLEVPLLTADEKLQRKVNENVVLLNEI